MYINILSEQTEMINLLTSGDATFVTNTRGIKTRASKLKHYIIFKGMHPKTIVNNYHKVPAKHLKSFSIFSEILPKKD